jgi:hypothetical protein
MPRDGAFILSDLRSPTLSIVCEPCGRLETYDVARLMERHGDAKLTDLPADPRQLPEGALTIGAGWSSSNYCRESVASVPPMSLCDAHFATLSIRNSPRLNWPVRKVGGFALACWSGRGVPSPTASSARFRPPVWPSPRPGQESAFRRPVDIHASNAWVGSLVRAGGRVAQPAVNGSYYRCRPPPRAPRATG